MKIWVHLHYLEANETIIGDNITEGRMPMHDGNHNYLAGRVGTCNTPARAQQHNAGTHVSSVVGALGNVVVIIAESVAWNMGTPKNTQQSESQRQ